MKKVTSEEGVDEGDYPHDKDNNIITPNGIIPYQDIERKWRDIKDGDVRGTFIRWSNLFVKLHDNNTGKTSYIPLYETGGRQCFCIEDLTNCGFSHKWNPKSRTTNMNYDGTTFTGLSKQKKTAGDVYESDITVYINGKSIFIYNIGGYSLAEFNSLRRIVREAMNIEIVSLNDIDVGKLDKELLNMSSGEVNVYDDSYDDRVDTVKVSIPTFKVTVNGQVMDSVYNTYPCLVYKDITYFPMTYDYSRFLGLKANWYENSRMNDKGVLFIGVSDKSERQSTLKNINRNKKNKKYNNAKLANYGLLVNSIKRKDLIDNKHEEYPILNFRGISYFPLTWRYAVDEFGWKYSFDEKNGLQINSEDPFKPVIYDEPIGYTMPHMPVATYEYDDNYYLVVPHSAYSPVTNLVYRKRGEKERVYNIFDELQNGKYTVVYLNMQKDVSGGGEMFMESVPYINGNILSLWCKGHRKSDNPKEPIWEEIVVKIDLNTGKIISEEIVK